MQRVRLLLEGTAYKKPPHGPDADIVWDSAKREITVIWEDQTVTRTVPPANNAVEILFDKTVHIAPASAPSENVARLLWLKNFNASMKVGSISGAFAKRLKARGARGEPPVMVFDHHPDEINPRTTFLLIFKQTPDGREPFCWAATKAARSEAIQDALAR